MNPRNHILLTIDVEDWFQVENFKQHVPYSSWPSHELRVEKNTHRLLNLLDSITLGRTEAGTRNPKPETRNSPKASFFILGWIAERLPRLVREIHARGHEVASHGYYHKLCDQESPDALKKDLTSSKKLLEDIIGAPVYGYRAPSFSINNDILKIIEDCGYLYDSSYNSFAIHGRYGRVYLSQNGKKDIAYKISEIRNPKSEILYELPISNLKLGDHILRPLQNVQFCSRSRKTKVSTGGILDVFRGLKYECDAEIEQKGPFSEGLIVPWGGGAYFRLLPSPLFRMGVESILKKKNAYLFYMHPWEIDPEQPRVNDASPFFKFRHYQNLNKTYSKLKKFIETFKKNRFISCRQYIDEVGNQSL